MCETLPHHMISLMACRSFSFSTTFGPLRMTTRSSASASASVSSLSSAGVKYRSSVCIRISVTPQDTCRGGSVIASFGSRMANAGRLRSVLRPRFSHSCSLVSTAESLVSLPDAGMVRITPTGVERVSTSRRFQNSQISVSGLAAPWAMALAVSITLPPPTAKIRSARNSTALFTPSRASSTRGLGCTPPMESYGSSASSSSANTRSRRPLRLALPPP